uniref:centrosomal protein of 44 kDa-like isoform X3 n=1 Tax=Myxine glutinosa TaxID=7769 RepID=UPI00358DF2DE
MATGDLRGNLRRLQQEMRFLHYPYGVDYEGLVRGAPEAVLPLLHHALVDVSPLLASELVQFDIQLSSKSDFRFVTAVYKALRDVLGIRPVLTREQLLQPGFAERKMQLVCTIGSAVRTRYRQRSKADHWMPRVVRHIGPSHSSVPTQTQVILLDELGEEEPSPPKHPMWEGFSRPTASKVGDNVPDAVNINTEDLGVRVYKHVQNTGFGPKVVWSDVDDNDEDEERNECHRPEDFGNFEDNRGKEEDHRNQRCLFNENQTAECLPQGDISVLDKICQEKSMSPFEKPGADDEVLGEGPGPENTRLKTGLHEPLSNLADIIHKKGLPQTEFKEGAASEMMLVKRTSWETLLNRVALLESQLMLVQDVLPLETMTIEKKCEQARNSTATDIRSSTLSSQSHPSIQREGRTGNEESQDERLSRMLEETMNLLKEGMPSRQTSVHGE